MKNITAEGMHVTGSNSLNEVRKSCRKNDLAVNPLKTKQVKLSRSKDHISNISDVTVQNHV